MKKKRISNLAYWHIRKKIINPIFKEIHKNAQNNIYWKIKDAIKWYIDNKIKIWKIMI